jgi:hypothetical protein
MAAARIKLFPLPVLLARLSRRLQLLMGGARDLPARQQTLLRVFSRMPQDMSIGPYPTRDMARSTCCIHDPTEY